MSEKLDKAARQRLRLAQAEVELVKAIQAIQEQHSLTMAESIFVLSEVAHGRVSKWVQRYPGRDEE